MPRNFFVCLSLGAMLAMLAGTSAAQEVDVLYIGKIDGGQQTDATTVVPEWAGAEVYATFLDSVASRVSDTKLFWPDGHSQSLPRIDSKTFEATTYFDTVAERDAAFPDGQYLIKINGGSSLAATAPLLTDAPLPMLITNYNELQNAPVGSALTIRWQGVVAPASPADYLALTVTRADGTVLVDVSTADDTLAEGATAYTLPPDLPVNEPLTAYLLYERVHYTLASNAFTSFGWSRGTALRFTFSFLVPPPTIVTPPAAQMAGGGRSASFSVVGSGSGLSYQWMHEGVPLAGATSATLNLPAVLATDAGAYSVVVTNAAGSVTSASAPLVVGPALQVSAWLTSVVRSTLTDGPPGTATFGPLAPGGAVLAADGKSILFVDKSAVRQMSEDGVVSTLAGSLTEQGNVDGTGANARFANLRALGLAPDGSIYVVETSTWHLRHVTAAGDVTTCLQRQVIGTPPVIFPTSVVDVKVDREGLVYVLTSTAIWRYDLDGSLTPWAGANGYGSTYADGIGMAARFRNLSSAAFAPDGSLWVTDNGRLCRITPDAQVSTIVADSSSNRTEGQSPNVRLNAVEVVVGSDGEVYVLGPYSLQRVTRSGWVTLLAGTGTSGHGDGTGPAAQFTGAASLVVTAAGKFYIFDNGSSTTVRTAVVQPGSPSPAPGTVAMDRIVPAGSMVALSAADQGPTAYYEWFRDGVAVGGSTSPALIIPAATAREAGTYVVRATNVVGSVSTPAGSIAIAAPGVLPSRIANLSIRTNAGASDQTLIAGFVVSGENGGSLPLLLRGIGPALGSYGVTGFLGDPALTLFSGSTAIAANDNWGGDATVTATAARVGAFALYPTSSRDAALLHSALTSPYTAQVRGMDGGTGVALMEVYDAIEGTPEATTPRLVNVSARADVQTGTGVLIAGFVVSGATSKTLLIRGVGPTLSSYGLGGVLADPQLEIYRGAAVLAQNDNWGGDPQLSAAASRVGAFGLVSGASKDAALLVTLEPGVYSALVRGAGATTGVALVEVYEVP